MAQFLDRSKLEYSFFHTFSKVKTEDSQYPFESVYKSKHTVRNNDVWMDAITYCSNVAAADAFALANPTIVVKCDGYSLHPIPGSNNQAYYIDSSNDGSGEFVKNWISPVDVPHPVNNSASDGFQARMYSNGIEIPLSTGKWVVDYPTGMILFEKGFTPINMGWTNLTVVCYRYVGKLLSDSSSGLTINNVNTKIIELELGHTNAGEIFDAVELTEIGDIITHIWVDILEPYDTPDSQITITIQGNAITQLVNIGDVSEVTLGQYLSEELYKLDDNTAGVIQASLSANTSTVGHAKIYVEVIKALTKREFGFFNITSQPSVTPVAVVEFDKIIAGNITMVSPGHFNLKAGKTYKIMGYLGFNTSSTNNLIMYMFRDDDADVNIGTVGSVSAQPVNNAYPSIAMAVYTPTNDIHISLEIIAMNGSDGELLYNACGVYIEEMIDVAGNVGGSVESLPVNIITNNNDYNITTNGFYIINVSGDKLINLPVLTETITHIVIKKLSYDSGTITVNPPATKFIDLYDSIIYLTNHNDKLDLINYNNDYFTM